MSWLGSLLSGGDLADSPGLENPNVPLTGGVLSSIFLGPRNEAGVTLTEKSALGMPAVYRAIAVIAQTSASLPLSAYETVDGVHRPLPTQPQLITKPHADMTRFEWLELVLVHLLGWGNAYLQILRNGLGEIAELWPVDPSRVRVGRSRVSQAKIYAISPDGGQVPDGSDYGDLDALLPLTDAEILHIPGLGYDGTVGLSPIAHARQAMGTAAAAEIYGAKMFGSGTMLSGILTTDQKLNQEQAEALEQRWKQKNAGIAKARDIAVLGNGTSFQPLSLSPADAQFIETARYSIAQVARIFGVPPHMLMDTDQSSNWGTGIEQQSIGFVRYTLQPWLVRIEQRLNKLLPVGQYAKFTVDGILRGDTATRYEAYAIGRNGGWLSVNDIRQLEDQPPIAGGDTYLQPLNMTPVGDGATLDKPNYTPAPPAKDAPTKDEVSADA